MNRIGAELVIGSVALELLDPMSVSPVLASPLPPTPLRFETRPKIKNSPRGKAVISSRRPLANLNGNEDAICGSDVSHPKHWTPSTNGKHGWISNGENSSVLANNVSLAWDFETEFGSCPSPPSAPLLKTLRAVAATPAAKEFKLELEEVLLLVEAQGAHLERLEAVLCALRPRQPSVAFKAASPSPPSAPVPHVYHSASAGERVGIGKDDTAWQLERERLISEALEARQETAKVNLALSRANSLIERQHGQIDGLLERVKHLIGKDAAAKAKVGNKKRLFGLCGGTNN